MERTPIAVSIGLVACSLLFAGCSGDEHRSPARPTPIPVGPVLREFQLSGEVFDIAGRPLGGSRVEAIDGPRAGTFVTTDDAGRFSMPGTFAGAVSVTASQNGFAPATRIFSAHVRHTFSLEPLAPPADIAGVYTLTLTAGTSCNLPVDARTRTYTATVARTQGSHFTVTLSDARFFSTYDRFVIGMVGDFAGLTVTSFDEVGVVEQQRDGTYLAFGGRAQGVFDPSGISASFNGYVQHCAYETPLPGGYSSWCSGGTFVQCDAPSHHLTLVRR